MRYTNLLEKLMNLFVIAGDSWINLGFLLFFVIILLLLFIKKISKKTGFILSCIGDICLIIYTIISHYDMVSKLIDTIINHLFTDIYFPSIYVYLFVFLFINVVTIGNLLNVKKKGIYHTVNGIAFLVTNFLLALILEIISKNKIDVFSKSSLFSNTDLILLLELSVSIFMIWLFSLGVIYLTGVISERILLRRERKTNLISEGNLEVNLAEMENTYVEETQDSDVVSDVVPGLQVAYEQEVVENQFIPVSFEVPTGVNKQLMIEEALSKQMQDQNGEMSSFVPVENSQTLISEIPNQFEQDYIDNSLVRNEQTKSMEDNKVETSAFDLNSFIPKKQENRVIQPMDTSTIFEQILNNQLPLTKEKAMVVNPYEEEKNTYTLNDYRVFNKILKDIKEHNQNNTIHIDKILEYRLITKYSSETYDLFKRMLKNYSN